jgi:tRNA-Thr(GGU) m(6)t(6)A37 methyltransferase TsaA
VRAERFDDLTPITMVPVAVVRSPRTEPTDDYWGGTRSIIEFDADRFSARSIAGLETFSHIEVVFAFHLYREDDAETACRRPRGRADWPSMGVFAQRNKHRPNRIGLSRAKLVAVEGMRVTVEGLDAVDGTPVLDVKPYFVAFGPRGEITEPSWVAELMRDYYATLE